MVKKNYTIRFSTVSSVQDFCNRSINFCGDIAFTSGRWVVNGKSVLGIFSLDLSKPVDCEIEGSEEDINKFESFMKELGII